MIALLALLLAVVNSPNPSVTYACDGVTAAYTVSFPYQTSGDLQITSTTPSGGVTTLVQTTDWTVNLASTSSTATLTLGAPATKCPSGNTLKIARNLALTQPTSFKAQTTFDSNLHERVYDRTVMQIQQVDAKVGATDIKAYVDAAINNTLTGGTVVQPLTWALTGDGSTSVFSIPNAVVSNANLYEVTIDGLVQAPITDYTVDSGTAKITFVSTPALNAKISVRSLGYARALSVLTPYQCNSAGCVSRTTATKLGDVVSVGDFGADPALSDNATAFSAVATYVNSFAPTASKFVTVVFPYGTYNYSGGLAFTSPVKLLGLGATLNYTGSGIAVKMGPDGIAGPASGIIAPHNHYMVEGLSFTGGASSTQGIYFNTFVTQPRVTNCYFYNFGSATGYAIFFQSQNWDARVTGVKWYASASQTQAYNFIRANGIASDGTTSDMGQSLMTVVNTGASNQSTGAGVGIYTAGAFTVIDDVKIEGFSPDIWVGSNAGSSSQGTRITNTYMEVVQGANPCVRYGESSGSYTGLFTEDLTLNNVYCNVHNTDLGTTAHLLGPASATSALQSTRVLNTLTFNLTAGQPIIVQNNLVSQTANIAYHNRQGTGIPDSPPNPLHTAGGNITAWGGPDGESMLFANSSDGPNVVAVQAGKTTPQYATFQLQDYTGALIGAYQCQGPGGANTCVLYGPTTSTGLTVPSTGGITIKTSTQATLGTPANGTILYCSDCTIANPCAAAGTGALAKRLNGVWVCN